MCNSQRTARARRSSGRGTRSLRSLSLSLPPALPEFTSPISLSLDILSHPAGSSLDCTTIATTTILTYSFPDDARRSGVRATEHRSAWPAGSSIRALAVMEGNSRERWVRLGSGEVPERFCTELVHRWCDDTEQVVGWAA